MLGISLCRVTYFRFCCLMTDVFFVPLSTLFFMFIICSQFVLIDRYIDFYSFLCLVKFHSLKSRFKKMDEDKFSSFHQFQLAYTYNIKRIFWILQNEKFLGAILYQIFLTSNISKCHLILMNQKMFNKNIPRSGKCFSKNSQFKLLKSRILSESFSNRL